MPIYEYQCQACKKRYELQQSFSAESTHTCEKCGTGIAKRLLHVPTVVFKGSGFYATDNKSGRVPVDNGADGDSGTSDTKDSSDSIATKAKSKSKSAAKASSGSDAASEAAV